MMREKHIEHKCRAIAIENGGNLLKWVSPGMRSVPDRILFLPGIVAFIEFKAPGKTVRPDQARFHRRMRGWGCLVYVIDDVETFKKLVETLLTSYRACDHMIT